MLYMCSKRYSTTRMFKRKKRIWKDKIWKLFESDTLPLDTIIRCQRARSIITKNELGKWSTKKFPSSWLAVFMTHLESRTLINTHGTHKSSMKHASWHVELVFAAVFRRDMAAILSPKHKHRHINYSTSEWVMILFIISAVKCKKGQHPRRRMSFVPFDTKT